MKTYNDIIFTQNALKILVFDAIRDHSFILDSVCSTDGGSFLGVEKPKSGRSRQASSRGSSRKKLLANSRPFTPQHTYISADSHASSDRSVGQRRDVTLQADSLEKHYNIIDTHVYHLIGHLHTQCFPKTPRTATLSPTPHSMFELTLSTPANICKVYPYRLHA